MPEPTDTTLTHSELDNAPLPQKVPKGGPEWWRRSFSYMTNMGMTPEEREEFEKEREIKREVDDCRRCERWRDYNLKHSELPSIFRYDNNDK